MGTLRAIGYARVSTSEQAVSGAGLEDQRRKLVAEIAHRGWQLADLVVDEGESGKDLARPGIRAALERLAAGDADALVVTKLDRLTRSTLDFAETLAWAGRLGVRLVVLDLGIDTSTETGKLVASVMASVAEWERGAIASRTRDAAAIRRSEGGKMGRPSVRDTNPALAKRIAAMRAELTPAGRHHYTWQAIADQLNAEGIPTVRGGTKWRVSAVQSAGTEGGVIRRPPAAKRVVLPEGKRRRRQS
jgi:DNA invertase Pin-like site-specific DNA recombinase